MSAVLSDYGVDVGAGVEVVDAEKVVLTVSEGAMPQVRAIELLTIRK
jgi:ribosomal protein L13